MAPAAGPQPTDADDSIVLADLVRTGEASRLRRRGALRLDHNPGGGAGRVPPPLNPPTGAGSAGPSSYAPPVRPIIIEPSRTPSPEPGADEYTYTAGPVWRDWEASGGALGMGRPPLQGRGAEGVQAVEILSETSQAGQAYVLYCGGDDACCVDDDEEELPRRFEPSLFPDLSAPSPSPSRASSSSSSRAQGKSIRKTNGCGALVHVRAYPQRPRGVWMAKEDAAETVVGLDPAYCEHPAMDKMLKSACGCIREGIGCSVCGNTLGTRYVPCQAASESIFSPTLSNPPPPSSSTPLRPFGPSYWDARPPPGHHRRPTSSTGPSRGHSPSYYTFFADRVTACPPYDLSSHTAVATVQEQRRDNPRPASPEIDYGYRWTASPQPGPTPLPPLPASEPSTSRDREGAREPLSPVFALPPLPPLNRSTSQLRPLSTSLPLSISVATRDLPPLVVRTPGGEPGLDLDPDGVPLGELDEPSSPDKESMSWPGR